MVRQNGRKRWKLMMMLMGAQSALLIAELLEMVKELLTMLEYWIRIQGNALIGVHMNATHESEGDAEHFVG